MLSDPMRSREIKDAFHYCILKLHKLNKFNDCEKPIPQAEIQDGVEAYEVEKFKALSWYEGNRRF